MGLFDRFKTKKPTDALLEEICRDYGLQWRDSELDFYSGAWWDGTHSGSRMTLLPIRDQWHVGLGQPEEITDIYLGALGEGEPPPEEESPQNLRRHLDDKGRALANRYCLLAYPNEPFDFPQLRQPQVVSGLLGLKAIREVCIYESMKGLNLILARKELDRIIFDANIQQAQLILKGLEAWRRR